MDPMVWLVDRDLSMKYPKNPIPRVGIVGA